MKKYFMKGTEDEVQLGETVSVIQRTEEDGMIRHIDIDCILTPETAILLAEKKVIDIIEEDEDSDFNEDAIPNITQVIAELMELQDNVEHRIEMIEKNHKILCHSVAELNKKLEGWSAADIKKTAKKK